MKKMLLVAAASAAILTSTAFAMDDQFYLKVEGGAEMLNKAKDKPTNIKMKSNTAGIIGAGVGYYVMDNVRGELTLDFLLNPEFKKSGQGTWSNVFGTGNNVSGTGTVKHKGKVGSLLLNGYVDFYEVGAFKFHAGAGVGVAQLSEKIQYSASTGAATVQSQSIKVKKVYNFAYQVGLGASAAVADGVKVELGYSWRDYGKTKSKTATNYGKTATFGKTPYRGHNIIAGVRFDI